MKSPKSAHPRAKLLFVAAQGPMGGSNVSVLTLLRALGPVTYKIVAAPNGAFLDCVRSESLADDVIVLPSGRGITRALQAWSLLRAARPKYRNFSAIHANATSGLRVAAPIALMTRSRVVVWVHDMATAPWRVWTGPIFRLLVRNSRWAAVSATARDVAVESRLCRREDVMLVANPIDESSVVAERSEGGLLTVSYLGNGRHRKGFDVVLAAIRATSNLPLRWKLFTNEVRDEWNAPLWDQLHALAQPGKVEICGPRTDVREAYAETDILLVPSRCESFGRVVAEAMLNRIPVVASNIEPFEMMLGGERGGLLFPVGDGQGAARCITRLVAEPELRRDLGERGRAWAVRETSPTRVADQFKQLYFDESAA